MIKVWIASYGNQYEGTYGFDVFSNEKKANDWLNKKRVVYGSMQMWFAAEQCKVK
jgi:hypothetical protein